MITGLDFVILNQNKERDTSAEYFAMQKMLYRNPSFHLKSGLEPEIERLKLEFLAEFGFMEYLLSLLDENFRAVKWNISKVDFPGRNVLLAGVYDPVAQKTLTEKTIEIKTYTKSKVAPEEIPEKIFTSSKLEIPKSNLYVQVFILLNNAIALAGYVNDVPSIKEMASATDYSVPVSGMLKMSRFIGEFKAK